MVVSEAVLMLKMRTYPFSFAASLVTFDKALTSLNISSSRFWGEQSFAVSDRTNMLNFMYSTVSVVQTDKWAISTITLSALGKCEKSLNLENGSPILGVGLREFSSQNRAKV